MKNMKEDVSMDQTNLLNLPATENEDSLKGKYLILTMGNELYGIEIRYITEIIGIQPVMEIPEMPGYVKGATNLRGKIIPVMDARLRFKKALREYDGRTCIIVLDTKDISIGLICGQRCEGANHAGRGHAPPLEIIKAGHKYIKGIGKAGGSVKLLLDCKRLLANGELEALGSMA